MTVHTPILTKATADAFLLNSLGWIPMILDDWMSGKTTDQIATAAAEAPFFAVHVCERKIKWEPCSFISDRSWTRNEYRLLSQALVGLERQGLVEVTWSNEHRPSAVRLTSRGEEICETLHEASEAPK